SNIVGFGTTSIGIGTYRFQSSAQLDGQERSAIYESNYQSTVSATPTIIHSLDKSLFDASKSVIQVSAGSTKALHQVMMICDGTDVYTKQLPFLSVSGIGTFDGASGIGTFGGEISGSDLILKFYPDVDQTGQIDIEVFSKSLYSQLDILNDYEDLTYGSVTESIDEKFYNAINLDRINKTNFKLSSNNTIIFSKEFNPNSASLVANTGVFTIQDHFFVTGEELIYTPNSTIAGVGTVAMVTPSGSLPSTVYAIKLTEDTFKVATTPAGIGVTFTSLGEGNAHRFTMKERNSKCIITVDGLIQYPITFTKTTHTLSGNVGGSLGISTNIVSLSGISTINPRDILLVDDEYMGVTNVGLGTTNVGPITNNGTINLVEVDRGFVGSSASTHTDTTQVRVYKGSFNIVNDEIHFSEPPRGNPQIDKTRFNLDYETSSFAGRVFFKSNYDNNKIYDDISDEFTGIGRTFTLKVGGANTTGVGTEGASGLVFINSIYQSPKTDNNPSRFNYEILEDSTSGITTVEFSGITQPDDPAQYVVSDYDINQNETPRGGLIVSYGSTPGLGFAPLVGASVTAVVSGGSIISVGLGTTDNLGSAKMDMKETLP
ncbi:MAG: YHYH protein, partial [Planctomycetota bacterium]